VICDSTKTNGSLSLVRIQASSDCRAAGILTLERRLRGGTTFHHDFLALHRTAFDSKVQDKNRSRGSAAASPHAMARMHLRKERRRLAPTTPR
jgi:hypothetical protein